MILIVLAVLTISNIGDITATTENLKITARSLKTVTAMNRVNPAPEEISSWIESRSKQNSFKMDELGGAMDKSGGATDAKSDVSDRKSKILRSLAFIAGLSVGDLAGAASSDVKTYTKFSPLGLNIGASRISPEIAAIYDMYNPYIFHTPLGFYTLWNPLRFQPINGIQQLPQNQMLNVLDNNKSTNFLNSDDEYGDEAKKIENVKTATNTDENNKSTEFQVEDDRNAEEKVLSTDTACNARNEAKRKQITAVKNISKDRENSYGSLTIVGLRAANATDQNNAIYKNTAQINGTGLKNDTNNTETYGYYGGYPQNINHIDLTTDAYQHKYSEYEHINYNSPTYDRPTNFYSNDRYSYYPVPPVDPYATGQFHQDQNSEYYSNDFQRYVYPSDNTPSFVSSDFRPVV